MFHVTAYVCLMKENVTQGKNGTMISVNMNVRKNV